MLPDKPDMRIDMTKLAHRSLLLALFLSFLLVPANVRSEKIVDPHGREGLCHYCHKSKVVRKGTAGFRLSTEEATCLECHGKRGVTFEDYLRRMLPDVRDKDKLIVYFSKHPDFSCHICHHVMCQSNSREQLRHRNPHIQLDFAGKPIEKRCLLCHTSLPDYRHRDRENVVMRYDLTNLCSLCHVMMTQKVGLGLGKRMTEAMTKTKQEFEKKYDVSLPLGPDNTVVCASCHNPHQFGVVLGKGGYAAAPGEHRLVLEDPWRLCIACHPGQYYK